MKLRSIVTISFILLTLSVVSAKDVNNSADEEYQAFADKMPEPVGGLQAIYNKVSYPAAARSAGVQGKVYILAFINEEGNVDDAKVVMGIGSGCDEQAIKAVKSSKFSPAIHEGKAIKVKYSIPIAFQL